MAEKEKTTLEDEEWPPLVHESHASHSRHTTPHVAAEPLQPLPPLREGADADESAAHALLQGLDGKSRLVLHGLDGAARRQVHQLCDAWTAAAFPVTHHSVPTTDGAKDLIVTRGHDAEDAHHGSHGSHGGHHRGHGWGHGEQRGHAQPRKEHKKIVTLPALREGASEGERAAHVLLQGLAEQPELQLRGLAWEARKAVHELCEEWTSQGFAVDHESEGRGDSKVLVVTRVSPAEAHARAAQASAMAAAVAEHRATATAEAHVEPSARVPVRLVRDEGGVRVANWNIEWMDAFFQGAGDATKFAEKTEKGDVAELCKGIAGLLLELEPDVVAIEEGPSGPERLELFVDRFLHGAYDVLGGLDGGTQRIYVLVRKNGNLRNARLCGKAHDYLSQKWLFDLAGDLRFQEYGFVRRPLVVQGEVVTKVGTKPFFVVAMHCKSKFVARGERMWGSRKPTERLRFVKHAIKNRRKIAAELTRTRKMLDSVIFANESQPFVVALGDFNDGPGQDFFEEYYLLFDTIDRLLGSPFQKNKLLRPLLIRHRLLAPQDQWSASFYDYVDDIKDKHVLLDHIFVSDALNDVMRQATVAHELFEKHNANGNPRFLSDHRPVFADFAVSEFSPRPEEE